MHKRPLFIGTIPSAATARKLIALLACGSALSCCASATLDGRQSLAQDIAGAAHMSPITLKASPFLLSGYARIENPGAPADLYIEGDGLAWLSKSHPSMNPTPTDPIALRLAAQDGAPNVIYLARPCQYSGRLDGTLCPRDYWMGRRYAPEVMQSYNQALDDLKTRYHIQDFNITGFSGGATVAALLAGQRSDITSLRSVAGNLDHRAHSHFHGVSELSASLNPSQYAVKLAQVPQYHFIGADDQIVPAQIFQSYAAALPNQRCVHHQIVQNADHAQGWVQKWPELLRLSPTCL